MSAPSKLAQDLNPKELSLLSEGLALGEYNLLLGAGASIGGFGGGQPLLGGRQLAEKLTIDFALPTEGETLSLPEAYEAAQRRVDTSGRTIQQYLEANFTNCMPPEWQSQLPDLTWRRIWTLNIDDTVEATYAKAESGQQRARRVSWIQRYADPDPLELQIVHLHGSAYEPSNIVFSVAEYLSATDPQHVWHRIFGDLYIEKPFIVVGAALMGEFDLAEVVRRGSQSYPLLGRPSIYVSRKISALQRESVRAGGLIPIELTAGEFFRSVLPEVRAVDRKLKALTGVTSATVPPDARLFLEQFTPLKVDVQPPLRRRDFYHGYDPTWFDILIDKDAIFGVVRQIVQSLRELRESRPTSQRLELVYGPWGSGKSTALLRIGRELIREGQDIYLFRADYALEAEATAWWLQRRPNTILLFDGVADLAPEIATLLSACRQADIRCHIVGVERQPRLRRVKASIPPEFIVLAGERNMRRLSDRDVEELLSTLNAQGRLGRITRWSQQRRKFYFTRDSGGQLFAAMSGLEGGPGFFERLSTEFKRWENKTAERDLLALAAFAYEFGYPLPIGIAVNATGLSSESILRSVDGGTLGEWLDTVSHGIRVRHRHIAELIVESVLAPSERYRLSQQLARSLAPRINPSAIFNRALPYLIVRNLLDAGNIRRWVGDSATRWYAELHSEYSWNARYWEQRALSHLRIDDQASARSFAERAVQIYRDPFTQTTLAYVMLSQLAASLDGKDAFNIREYEIASGLLVAARDTSREQDYYPFTVFFEGSLRLMRVLARSSELPGELTREFEEWLEHADRSPLMAYRDYAELIARVRREFLRVS